MKLPINYVPGVGVKKATGFGGIGQRLLEKQGWKHGQGLGKDNSGMAEALEVKKKEDVLGVGATGGWDWSLKFWEEAYNSAAQGIQHDGSSSSTSTSVSSQDDSSSDEEDATPSKNVSKEGTPASKQKAAQRKASDSSSDSSSTDSDSDSGAAGKRRKHKKSSSSHSIHRDGTIAAGASAAELAIAAELAKDPWGRWGGKAGKMARIRQQEEEAAARAREKLGLSLPGAKTPEAKAAKQTDSSNAKDSSGAGGKNGKGGANGTAEPAKRIVVTLTIPEDKSIKRASFVRTPATGWWGASYFVSAGALEGMEEAGEHVNKKRKTFDESDQANLYMQVHLNQRVGHKGLGKSTTVNVAGGKWEGTKKTFDDENDDAAPAANQPADAVQGDDVEPATTGTAQQAGSEQGRKVHKKRKGKGDIQAPQSPAHEAAAVVASTGKDSKSSKGSKQKKRKQPAADVETRETAAAVHNCETQDSAAGSTGQTAKAIKWLKVIKVMLKEAPKRRLKLEKLCKRLVQHAEQHHSKHHKHMQAGLQRSYSQQDVTSIVNKKAKKSKVVIRDGFVSLP